MPFLPEDTEGYQDGLTTISEAIKRLASTDLVLALRLVLYLLKKDIGMDEETKQAILDIRNVLGRLSDTDSGVTIKEYLRRINLAVSGEDETLGTGAVLSAINAFAGLARETNFGQVPRKEPEPEGDFTPSELWYCYGMVNQSGVWRYTYYESTQNANNSGYWFRLIPEWIGWDIHLVWPRGRLPIGNYAIETRRVFTNGTEDSAPTSTLVLEYVADDNLPYDYSLQNTISESPFQGQGVQYVVARLRFIPQNSIPSGQTPYTLIGSSEQQNPGVIYVTPPPQ